MTTQFNSDYIKRTLRPHEFYSYELPTARLNRPGWNNGGLCPFHQDNRPNSFRVNLESGSFKCFSCGAAGGDILAFYMKLHGLNFYEALRQLTSEWGL